MNLTTMIPRRCLSATGAVALGLTLACAPPAHAGQGATDEAATLKGRAEKIWNARVQDQWDVVYDLMALEEQQAAGDRDKWTAYNKEKGWFKYHTAKVGDAHVDKTVGWVDVVYTTGLRQYPTMPTQETKVWDLWLKNEESGEWRPAHKGQLALYPTRPPAVRPADEEAALWKRQDALWRAREAQDWAAIYEFMDPGYRAATPKENFLKRKSKYLYLRHKVEWVEVQGTTGRTKVFFEQKLNDPTLHKLEPSTEVGYEAWVKTGGEWYRFSKPEGPPPAATKPADAPKN